MCKHLVIGSAHAVIKYLILQLNSKKNFFCKILVFLWDLIYNMEVHEIKAQPARFVSDDRKGPAITSCGSIKAVKADSVYIKKI